MKGKKKIEYVTSVSPTCIERNKDDRFRAAMFGKLSLDSPISKQESDLNKLNFLNRFSL